MGQKIVKDFRYKGRRCVVIEIDRDYPGLPPEFKENSSFKPYCNGYIELKEDEILGNYDDYKIKSDEITYQGNLNFPKLKASDGKMYIGFDSAHYWNEEHPESKTAEYVENTCKKIADELTKGRNGRQRLD